MRALPHVAPTAMNVSLSKYLLSSFILSAVFGIKEVARARRSDGQGEDVIAATEQKCEVLLTTYVLPFSQICQNTSYLLLLRHAVLYMVTVIQSWAIGWALGCVNSRPMARGSQEAGFTQPRAHLLADPCRLALCKVC